MEDFITDKGEVSVEVLDGFRAVAEEYVGDPEAFFGPHSEVFAKSTKWVEWDRTIDCYDMMREALEAQGRKLEDIGYLVLGDHPLGQVLKLLKTIVSPTEVIIKGNRFGMTKLFPILDFSHEKLEDGRILVQVSIPRKYRASESFLRTTAGVLSFLPTAIGYPPAVVEAQYTPRRATYVVTPARKIGLWTKLKSLLAAVFTSSSLVKQLTDQQQELNLKYLEVSKLNHRLVETNRKLSEALETKSRFLQVISHELMTPLNGIIGAQEAIKDGVTADIEEAVDELEVSSHRLKSRIDDIIEMERLQNKKSQPEAECFALSECLEQTMHNYRTMAEKKGLNWCSKGLESLPQWIQADERRLIFLFSHLLDNAVKFTHQGFIEIRFRHDGKSLVIEVEDSGIGIERDDWDKIFELFTQIDSGVQRSEFGLGLGLSLAHRTAETLGGRLLVRSTPQKGSVFTVSIPVSTIDQEGSLPLADLSLPILVVDDERVNRSILARQLEKRGFAVDSVENGQKAVNATRSVRYGLIFMDYEMPVMDGATAAELISKSHGQQCPLMVGWSASADENMRERFRNCGVKLMLTKPLSSKQLDILLDSIGGQQKKAAG